MRKLIQIDSREAGAGKTTEGIYPRVRELFGRGQQILIVVPSVRLQEQYSSGLSDLRNNMVVINSGNANAVTESLIGALYRNESIIIITHQAFRQTVIPYDLKSKYHLIIDEALDPWSVEEVKASTDELVSLSKAFSISESERCNQYALLTRSGVSSSLLDGRQWKTLMSANNDLYVDIDSWNQASDVSGNRQKIYIYVQLSQSIMERWRSIWVAAAAFDKTFMHIWFDLIGYEQEFVHEFSRHKRNIHIYTHKDFTWSRDTRKRQPLVLTEFLRQVDTTRGVESILMLKNNDEVQCITNSTKLEHNAHGINEFSHHTNICLASAINPSPAYKGFLTNRLASSDIGFTWTDGDVEKFIVGAFTAYNFYQLVMRTNLRVRGSDQLVRVFVLDSRVAVAFSDYFEIDNPVRQYHFWDSSYIKPAKKAPMTGAERKRRHLAKKRLLDANKSQ